MNVDLEGVLVIGLEQAVAAPFCTARLADAGARVIKVERPEGDFARGYDRYVKGQSTYFVWLKRGKESMQLDLKSDEDRGLLQSMIARADVVVQNLAPGALERLGLGSGELRRRHPRLITCDISGYGDDGPYSDMKAYDLLEARINAVFGQRLCADTATALRRASIAFGLLNDIDGLIGHPQLRTINVDTPAGEVTVIAPRAVIVGQTAAVRPVPALGQHSKRIRAEFGEDRPEDLRAVH